MRDTRQDTARDATAPIATARATSNMTSRRALWMASVVGCVSLGGCSLLNPYIDLPKPAVVDQSAYAKNTNRPPDGQNQGAASVYSPDLDVAIRQGEQLEDRYSRAMGAQQYLKNGLAVGLPLLGAGALFGIATGQAGHSNFPSAVAFGSAAAITSANLLTAPSREQIWNSGKAAVNCAVTAASRFRMSRSDYDAYFGAAPSNLRDAAAKVDRGLVEIAPKLDAVRGLQAQDATTQGAIDAATSAVAAANAASDRARGALGGLAQARIDTEMAGSNLRGALRGISTLVDGQIQATTYDLTKLQGILAGLAATAGQLPGGGAAPGAPAAAPAGQGASAGLNAHGDQDTIAALQTATAALNADLRSLQPIVQQAEDDALRFKTPPADSCAGAGGLFLSVDVPPNFQVSQTGEAYISVHVPTQSGQPAADVSGPGDISHDIIVAAPNYRVHLKPAQNAGIGSYRLVVSTGDGAQRRVVDFPVVDPNAPGAASPPAVAPPGAPGAAAPAWATPDWMKVLQFGVIAGDWTAALKAYDKEHIGADTATSPTPELTPLKDQAIASGALNDFEFWWSSTARIQQLQQALGVAPASGVYDAATRAALSKLPASDHGKLTRALINGLHPPGGAWRP